MTKEVHKKANHIDKANNIDESVNEVKVSIEAKVSNEILEKGKAIDTFRVAKFLAIRAIKNSSRWTTGLIIFVMVLTFLNLIVVSGILVGLIQGSETAFRERFIGDLGISKLDKKTYVENADQMMKILDNDSRVTSYSTKYQARGTLEANYKTRRSDEIANKRSVGIYGVDIAKEDQTSHICSTLLEGSCLTPEDASKYILIGKNITDKYSVVGDADPSVLRGVETGTKVRLTISRTNTGISTQPALSSESNDSTDISNEYIVKGIYKMKAGELDQNIYMIDSEVRRLAGLTMDQVSLISVRVSNSQESDVKNVLVNNGFDRYAKIETFAEGTPEFVKNMKQLFGLLGNFFGSIAIVVAAITLYIVIFINALNKKKQIGILKGIGIKESAIELSYVMQAIFYGLIGSGVGVFITFVLLKPAFAKHPIDFPFSDGILVADFSTTMIRVGILLVVTIVAGYIPARMIVKKNTLNAILGR